VAVPTPGADLHAAHPERVLLDLSVIDTIRKVTDRSAGEHRIRTRHARTRRLDHPAITTVVRSASSGVGSYLYAAVRTF
jgi:hypothetical protein